MLDSPIQMNGQIADRVDSGNCARRFSGIHGACQRLENPATVLLQNHLFCVFGRAKRNSRRLIQLHQSHLLK